MSERMREWVSERAQKEVRNRERHGEKGRKRERKST